MQTETYGSYVLDTWPRGHLWQTRATLDGREIGERAQAASAADAMAQKKAELDARDHAIASSRGKDNSPSALEYHEAFSRLSLNDSYEAMLRAHYLAPGQRITATQLAAAAGYENYHAANLHYGNVGKAVAMELGYSPRKRPDGTTVWTAAIADDAVYIVDDPTPEQRRREQQRLPDDPHFEWHMRPQVIEALKSRYG